MPQKGSGGFFANPASTFNSLLDANSIELRNIVNAVPLGVILINTSSNHQPFANRNFRTLPSNQQEMILRHIRQRIREIPVHSEDKWVNEEVEIREGERNHIYGYTIYPMRRDYIPVFVSEIAAKSILQQSRQGNLFYDRLSEIISEIAHEVGNPLTGILTMLQVMQLNLSSWPTEKINDYVQRCINELDRLNDFLKRIRNISGEIALSIRSIELRDFLLRVYKQNQERFEAGKIKFLCNVESGIFVRVDEGAFYQVFLNMINNSLFFLKPGKMVSITMDALDESFVSLVYGNDGPAIPEEDLERIFSPFFTTRKGGEGIGLAISRKLITRMGGAMNATLSLKNGKGVRFLIHIPRGDRP